MSVTHFLITLLLASNVFLIFVQIITGLFIQLLLLYHVGFTYCNFHSH